MIEIPIYKKYNMTIKEASAYFEIGENRLRKMIKEPGCSFVIYVGNKALIKRCKLEEYLDGIVYL